MALSSRRASIVLSDYVTGRPYFRVALVVVNKSQKTAGRTPLRGMTDFRLVIAARA